jgi:hypothetical protein
MQAKSNAEQRLDRRNFAVEPVQLRHGNFQLLQLLILRAVGSVLLCDSGRMYSLHLIRPLIAHAPKVCHRRRKLVALLQQRSLVRFMLLDSRPQLLVFPAECFQLQIAHIADEPLTGRRSFRHFFFEFCQSSTFIKTIKE